MPEDPSSKHSQYSRYTIRSNMGTKRQEEPKKPRDTSSSHSRYLHFSGTGRKPTGSENAHVCMHGRKEIDTSTEKTAAVADEFSSVSRLKHIFDDSPKEISTRIKLDANKRKSASLPERFRSTTLEPRPVSDPIGAKNKTVTPPRLRNIAEGIAEKRAKFERGSSLESITTNSQTDVAPPLQKRRPHSVSLTDLVPELLETEGLVRHGIINEAETTDRTRTGSDPGKKPITEKYRQRSHSLVASAERRGHSCTTDNKHTSLGSHSSNRSTPSPPSIRQEMPPLLKANSLDSVLDQPVIAKRASVLKESTGQYLINGNETDSKQKRKINDIIPTCTFNGDADNGEGTDSEADTYSGTSDSDSDDEGSDGRLKLHEPVFHYNQPLRSALSKKASQNIGKKKCNVVFKEDRNPFGFTYAAEEYERGNNEIDPVTASAEWELEKRVDKMDIFSVDLEKDDKGLGLSIIGLGVGTDTGVEKLGIFVKSLTPGGTAEKDKRISVNDQILEVDGISLVGVTQMFAAQTLKNTKGIVRFLMGREKGRQTYMLAAQPEPEVEQKEVDNDFVAMMGEKLDEFGKRVQEAEDRAKIAEDKAAEVEERAINAEQKLASLQRSSQHQNNKASTDNSSEVKKLEKHLSDMTDRARRAESDLACAEAENEDMVRQLEESKGLYMILEKKFQESKSKIKEYSEREVSYVNDLVHLKKADIKVLQLEQEVIRLRRENAAMAPANDQQAVQTKGETTGNTYTTKQETDNRLIAPSPSIKTEESLSSSLEKIHQDEKTTEKETKVNKKITSDLSEAVPETEVLSNNYMKDKRRISPTKRKPTRAAVLSSSSNEFMFGGEDEDENEQSDEDRKEHNHERSVPKQFALPGLQSDGGFRLRPASDNPLKGKKLPEKKSSPVLEGRSSFPFACKDEQPDLVVENLLIKQTSNEVNNEVESLPALLEHEGINIKDDDDEDDDDDDDDDDVHSSVSSSNGSSSFMPPAMPLLSVGARPPSANFPSTTPDLLPTEEQRAASESGSNPDYPPDSDTSRSLLSSTGSQDPAEGDTGARSRVQPLMSWTTRPIQEWDGKQVGMWLIGMDMEQYKEEFENKGIDGKQLLNVDTSKLKMLGVSSSDRAVIKKKVKEMKTEMEKELKAMKAREKENKAAAKKDSKVKTEKKAFRRGKYIVTQ